MQQLEKIFKNLPKRLEWKSFYVNDFPLVREFCDDIRKISLENQLNKSQIKAISEVKKTSQEAYQHIVNHTQSSDTPKIENNNQGEKSASIFPLRDMRGAYEDLSIDFKTNKDPQKAEIHIFSGVNCSTANH